MFSDAQITHQKTLMELAYFGVDDGLSSRIIHCFFQDSRGFIWVGTDYGLNRFDGQNFKVYTQEQDGLSHNEILKIIELADGKLWLSSSSPLIFQVGNSIDIFDPITETNIPLTEWVENPSLLENEQVYGMYLGEDETVFLPTLNGNIYQCKSKRLSLFAQLQKASLVHQIEPDQQGGIWVNDKKQLVHIDALGHHITRLQVNQNQSLDLLPVHNPTYIDYEIGPINRGKSSMDRLIKRLHQDGKDELLFTIDAQYLRLTTDVASKSAQVIHHETKEFGRLTLGEAGKEVFQSMGFQLYMNSIDHVSFWDRQGGGWMTNPPDGIIRFQLKGTLFQNYLENRAGTFHKTTATRGILIDKANQLRIGSRQELHTFFEDETKPFKFLEHQVEILRKEYTVLSLLSDENQLIVGTSQGSLFTKPIHTEDSVKVYTYTTIPDTLSFSTNTLWHWSLLKDRKQRIWLGHQHGLSYLDNQDGQLHVYSKLNGFSQLYQSLVNQLHENEQGIWLVSSSGLYLLDVENGIEARYSAEGEGEYKLPHSQFHHLYEDQNGYFWLATNGGGLIKWHPITKEMRQFTNKDGLSHNVLYAIYEDEFNNLWLSSNLGIMRFEKDTYFVTKYLPSDGITHEEFNRISHFQAEDGTIYFGGLNGVTSFHPKDFQLQATANSSNYLQFTELKVQNSESAIWKDLSSELIQTQKIKLQPSDLGFTLAFAHLDFNNQKKNQYAYLIEGFDQDWNYQQANFIRVNQLPYGTYQLRIKAQEDHGIWGKEKVIEIEVIKPIYLHAWFVLLICLIFLFLVAIFIKWRLYRLEKHRAVLQQEVEKRTKQIEADKQVILKQTKELTKLDKLKTRFFTNISHELRTPLTLILGPAKHAQSSPLPQAVQETLRTIEANGENLLQLVEEILELAKLESDQIQVNEQPVKLKSLLTRLYANFESQAAYLGIQYTLEPWEGDDTILLDVSKVSKVINNLIGNALKFTPKGEEIIVSAIQLDADTLAIQVTDTGKGIHLEDLPHLFERFYQSKQVNGIEHGGTGIGLALSKELAELMKGSLTVKSTLNVGSTFTFVLPFKPTQEQTPNKDALELPMGEFKNTPLYNPLPQEENQQTGLSQLLLVEDNPSMQQFVASLLRDDYHVFIANHGQEALDILEEGKKIDLIISDVMMPQMDGFTLLKQLKSTEKWRQIPVVILTARAAEADRLHALQIGVDDYLTKPFSSQELQARIQNLLANYQERQLWQSAIATEQEEQITAEAPPDPTTVVLPQAEVDREWLKKLEHTIIDTIGHHHLTIEDLADAMNLSQRQLGRKLKQLTGLTPLKYQRELQLQKARQLLEKGTHATVAEVVYEAGFKTHHHFTQLYIARFGKKPSEYFKAR